MDNNINLSKIESILFALGKPITIKQLSKLLNANTEIVQNQINDLRDYYEKNQRGVRIVSNNNSIELVTAPENFEDVKKVIDYQNTGITQAQIETLTILAYQGPLTKPEVEKIRGVNCTQILNNLIYYELIDETIENQTQRYQVSTHFLKALGITSLEQLPDYQKFKLNLQQY